MIVYFMEPLGPVMVSGGSMGGALPRSDTISAALMCQWGHVDSSADIGLVAQSPPFRVSSALPWVTAAGERLLFVPTPAGLSLKLAGAAPEDRKLYRRVDFITVRALTGILRGEIRKPSVQLAFWEGQGHLLVDLAGDSGKAGPSRAQVFVTRESRPRLEVDRWSGGPVEGLLFESNACRFASGCGWALAAEVEPSALSTFESALELLSLHGVGQDRTVGQGSFKVAGRTDETVAFGRGSDASRPLGGAQRMLLSLCHPTRSQVASGLLDGAYGLVDRGGWVTAPGAATLRRATVTMAAEGSWYPATADSRPGDVVKVLEPLPDLGLQHPVYRDGRALTMLLPGNFEGGTA